MTVPAFDFSHCFTYDELVAFLEQLAAAYPQLMQLQAIGSSYGGRTLWLATLTHQSTGPALEKPGYWIDGNTRAGEVTGSAIALYILYYLLTHYDQDPQAQRLLDGYTVYILPRIAVDGAEKYLTTPYHLRSSIRPYPYLDERDGLYPEDVNGDGLILQMRIPDECGAWKVCEQDPRAMIRREPEEFGGNYYTVLAEGVIRNYDGYNYAVAPTFEGMDFNRNYPHQWQPEGKQTGAGDFPFSEPETRAEAEFWRENRNINGFITYHTYSAVILRPYGTHPDEHFPPEDLEIYNLIGKKGKQFTGYDCISVYHDFRYHPQEVTTGTMDDYAYDTYGWFGFTIELWDAPTAAGIKKEDLIQWFRWHPPEDELTLLRWSDEQLGGEGFLDWQPFEHPQLGKVEIGGWNFKRVWQNAPPQYLPELAQQHCQFAIAHGLMSPKLAARVTLTQEGAGVYHLLLKLENQGFLPTYTSKKALERKAVRPTEVTLVLPEGAKLIAGKLSQEIDHLEGRSNKAFRSVARGSDYRCTVEWALKAESGSEIEVIVQSERAGTLRQRLLV